MDLTIGCKEKVGDRWVYRMKDGTELSQMEWQEHIEAHIKAHGNQDKYDRIRSQFGSKRWFDEDTPHDFTLQRYAASYCTNVEVSRQRDPSEDKVVLQVKTIKDELGCDQLILG